MRLEVLEHGTYPYLERYISNLYGALIHPWIYAWFAKFVEVDYTLSILEATFLDTAKFAW